MSATAGDEWTYAVALRRESAGGKPFGVTRLFLNPALKGIDKALRGSSGPVYALIEREYGARIDRVEQVITAVALDELDAANLGVPAGTPALANASDRLGLITVNKFGAGGSTTTTYKYNDEGIRVSQTVGAERTLFHMDPNNHTGYAQVFEEGVENGAPGATGVSPV